MYPLSSYILPRCSSLGVASTEVFLSFAGAGVDSLLAVGAGVDSLLDADAGVESLFSSLPSFECSASDFLSSIVFSRLSAFASVALLFSLG